jgi:outer membrane protein
MRKVLLLAVVVASVMVSCQKSECSKEQKTDFYSYDSICKKLPIAYVNLDTILLNCEYAVEANEKLIKKQEDARLNINTKAKKLQEEMEEFQRKLENNAFLSRERAEQEAARIQKKELELQQLDQKLTQELLKEQQDVNQKLHEDLIDVIKHFNKDNRFHMILSTSAMQEQVVYAIDGYDISSEIIKMLNNQELMKEIKEKE